MTAADIASLPTGWDPDTPADDTLARQALLAHVAGAQHTAHALGARCMSDGTMAAADLGLPGLFGNRAFLLDPGRIAEALDLIDAFFRPGTQYLLASPFPTDDLRHRGLELVGHPPLMYLPPGRRAPDPPPALTVEEVADAARLAVFERTLVEAYPLPEWADLPAGAALPPSTLNPEAGALRMRYWVGTVEERAVCTAAAVTHAGVNLVEWVGTQPGDRGRGYGAAVTWAAAQAAPELPAVLLASDDGRPVYERMGFIAVQRWTLWTRPLR